MLYGPDDRPLLYAPTTPSSVSGSWRNADRNRTRGGRRGPIGSADAHADSVTLEKLIRDCTALTRNNLLAQAVVAARSDHVVGHSPTVEARSEDEAWNRDVEMRWAEWCDGACDVTGQMSFAEICGAVCESWDDAGGIIANKVDLGHNRVGLEMIEVVRLMNERGGADRRGMHGGVEYNALGRPVAYWLADWNDQMTSLGRTPRRYDATGMWLVNNPHLQRVGQHRTVPRLASVVDRFETIERAGTSTWGAYELATYIALFIKNRLPESISIEDYMAYAQVGAGEASSVAQAKDRGVWKPLSVLEGAPGEEIQQVKPEHPTTGFDQMFWTELQAICSAMGMPPELVYMRFVRNYSASRSAISVGWKKVLKYQEVMKRRFIRPVYHWWLANEQLAGRVRIKPDPEWKRCEVILPGMPVLDPKVETEALGNQLSLGLCLHEDALRQLGKGDRAEFMRKWMIEKQENEAAGLSYSQTPQVTRSEQVDPYALEGENADA